MTLHRRSDRMSHRTQTLEIAVTYLTRSSSNPLLQRHGRKGRLDGISQPSKEVRGVRSDNGPWSMLESCGRAATQMEDTPATLRIKQPFGDLPDISSIGIANIRTHRWHIQPDTEEYSEPC